MLKLQLFNQKKKENHSLSGRSMIEMIAVLGIMGILSLGALSGVNYVKDKNLANQILKEALTQASEIQTNHRIKRRTNDSLEIIYPYEDSSEYIKSWSFQDVSKKEVILRAFNVSSGVCQKLTAAAPSNKAFKCIGSAKHESAVESCEDLGICENGNDLVFITEARNRESGGEQVNPCANVDCKTAQTGKVCSGGVCICPVGTAENEDGVCVDCPTHQKTACNIEDRWDTNGCLIWKHHDCAPNDCDLTTGKCCASDEEYNSTAGMCCPNLTEWNVCDKTTKAEDKVCPTRIKQCESDICNTNTKTCCPKTAQYGVQQIFSNGDCICPGNTVKRSDGECVCPTAGMTLNPSKTACICPAGTTITADQKSCVCPKGSQYGVQQIFSNGSCICPGNTVKNSSGECVCPTAGMTLNASKTACICPSGTTITSDQQSCTCPVGPTYGVIPTYSNGSCICPGNTVKNSSSECVCPSDMVLNNSKTQCVCPTVDGKQLTEENGKCLCPEETLSISLTSPSRCTVDNPAYCSMASKFFPNGEDPCTYRSSKTITLDGTYRIRYSSGNLNYRNLSGHPNNYTDAYLFIGQNQRIFSNECHEKSSLSEFKSCVQASSHVSTKELHGEYYLYAIDDLCYDNDANSNITIKFQKLINSCTPKD